MTQPFEDVFPIENGDLMAFLAPSNKVTRRWYFFSIPFLRCVFDIVLGGQITASPSIWRIWDVWFKMFKMRVKRSHSPKVSLNGGDEFYVVSIGIILELLYMLYVL